MKLSHKKPHIGGFSLIEVMVGLVVISVGLLGIAKMQAMAMSSTSGARMRSLAALQAAGLASAMHGDRSYWSNIVATPGAQFTVKTTNATVSSATDASLTTSQTCNTPSPAGCTTAQMAAADLWDWVAGPEGLSTQLPSPNSVISCYSQTAGAPVGCNILISWNEKIVNTNVPNPSAPKPEQVTYRLYVQP